MKNTLTAMAASMICMSVLAGCHAKTEDTNKNMPQPPTQVAIPVLQVNPYLLQAQLLQQQMVQMQQQFINNMQMMQQQQLQLLHAMNTLPMMMTAPTTMQAANSTSISYQNNGKTASAQVTQTWQDQNGKIQSKTYEIPANQMHSIVIVNGQLMSS